jgi:hypothetical protein
MAKKARIWDGSQWVDIASAVTDLTQYANLTTTPISGFRNAIINGDFRINQRGFSSTTTNSTYGFDRWQFQTSDGTGTHSTQSFSFGNAIPGYEPINHSRIVTSGQTLASAYTALIQFIEDVRTFAGQTITISFWAKAASGTPKIAVEFQQGFGTGGSPSAVVNTLAGQTTLSTSWTRYSLTVTLPSISGKTLGSTTNTHALGLILWVSAGSTYNTRTNSIGIQSNTFDIWGVQVEPGTIATPFEQRPIGTELSLCQRYFYSIVGGELSIYNPYFNVGLSGGGQYIPTPHPVRMRVAPTMPATTPFTYLQNAAGTALGFNVTLGSTVSGFTGVFSSTNNSGSVLPSGYTIGYNQATINLSSEF